MSEIGNSFVFRPESPQMPCPRFMQFARLYFTVATTLFGLKATEQEFMEGFQSMNIADYIRLLPEFKMAQKSQSDFDFVAPVIVLEGMKFFEDVLLHKISNK